MGSMMQVFAKICIVLLQYSKTCVKRPLSQRPKIGFQDQISLNAGQKYCRMFQGEHSAMLLTFIKQQFVIMIFDLSIFEFYTGLLYHHFASRYHHYLFQLLTDQPISIF